MLSVSSPGWITGTFCVHGLTSHMMSRQEIPEDDSVLPPGDICDVPRSTGTPPSGSSGPLKGPQPLGDFGNVLIPVPCSPSREFCWSFLAAGPALCFPEEAQAAGAAITINWAAL